MKTCIWLNIQTGPYNQIPPTPSTSQPPLASPQAVPQYIPKPLPPPSQLGILPPNLDTPTSSANHDNLLEEGENDDAIDNDDDNNDAIDDNDDDDGIPLDEGDAEEEARAFAEQWKKKGSHNFLLSLASACPALADLENIARPPRNTGCGYKELECDRTTAKQLEHMVMFLTCYICNEDARNKSNRGHSGSSWITSSLETAEMVWMGSLYAKNLRQWTHAFINNRDELPFTRYHGPQSLIEDEDLSQEIQLHLQSIGKFIKVEDIVKFLDTPEMLQQMQQVKTISLVTAKWWLKRMGYQWKKDHKGQYVDGHERKDVMDYCDNVFLPAMAEYEKNGQKWGSNMSEKSTFSY